MSNTSTSIEMSLKAMEVSFSTHLLLKSLQLCMHSTDTGTNKGNNARQPVHAFYAFGMSEAQGHG